MGLFLENVSLYYSAEAAESRAGLDKTGTVKERRASHPKKNKPLMGLGVRASIPRSGLLFVFNLES